MGCLVATENAFLDDHHAVAVGASVYHAGPDAAAGALTTGNDRVDAQLVEMSDQRRTSKRAGR